MLQESRSGCLFIAPCGSAGKKCVREQVQHSGTMFFLNDIITWHHYVAQLAMESHFPRASARGYEQTAATRHSTVMHM